MRYISEEYYGVIAGILATSLQLLVGEWMSKSIEGARSLVSSVGKAIIELTPGSIADVSVALVEDNHKPIIRVAIIGIFLGVGIPIGLYGLQNVWIAYGLLIVIGLIAAASAAIGSQKAMLKSITTATVGTISGMLAWFTLSNYPSDFLLLFGYLFALALLLIIHHMQTQQSKKNSLISLPAASYPLPAISSNCSFDIVGMSSLMTDSDSFYIADTSFPAPAIEVNSWRLKVFGLVHNCYELSWSDLLKMPLVELDATLVCVHNAIGGHRIGNARWLGLHLSTLIEKAGIHSGAVQIVARSEDGFSVTIPLSLLEQRWPALVAIGMNGKALTHIHGFPARLLVPGVYGFSANIKWLTSLEITGVNVPGFWEKRGWPSHPSWVQPQCRIDVPVNQAMLPENNLWIAGIAWAPPFGIQGVEVKINEEPWQLAQLAEELAPSTWRQWKYRWQPTANEYTIQVRTTGRKAIQIEEAAPPYPNGASGIHTIQVTVLPTSSNIGAISQRIHYLRVDVQQRIRLAIAGLKAW